MLTSAIMSQNQKAGIIDHTMGKDKDIDEFYSPRD